MAEARDVDAHQAGDLSLKAVGAGLGVIVLGIAIAVGVPWAVIGLSGTPSFAPNDASMPRIRPPVQETTPERDMAAFRREKMERLESYGVDPVTGRVHIPIERAMRMLVERSKAEGR
ncbi:MAG TPA: hypothetical protein VLS49_05325 [Usitatibacter sp.]|nr:hypothetical protein [Usitatibacter sp.]